MRRSRISHGVSRGNFSGGGPLYTDHLQDINLELDLLKRKREMLEQQQQQQFQQQQFIPPITPQNNFNQLPYYVLDQKPAASNGDFSRSYNTRSEQYSDGYEPYRESRSRKRQPDNDWRHNSNPKKSTAPRPLSSRSAASRQLSYRAAAPHQISSKSAAPHQLTSRSAGPPPTRNQRPYANRSQQINSTPFKDKQAKQFIGQKIINQKQQKPSKEFVTNKVTKASKASVPPNKLAAQPVATRNKLVAAASTSATKIKKNDCEDLRLHPDKEPTNQVNGRLELALGTLLKEIRDTIGSRFHYQVFQLQHVMKLTIRERIRNVMLGKIVGTSWEIIKEYRAVYPKDTDEELANMAIETENMKVENEPRLIDKEDPVDYFKTNVVKIIERRFNEIFDKLDQIYNPPESTENENSCPKEDTPQESNEQKDTDGAAKEVVANSEEQVPANTENVDSVEKELNKAASTNNLESANIESNKAASTDNLENANIHDDKVFIEYKRSLPRFIIKRHMPTFMMLLNMNKDYQKDLDEITSNTRAKFVERGASQHTSSTAGTMEPSQTPTRTTGYTVLPYYVKIMGKPKLPSKTEMNNFLQKFQPKSIKKHRTIHNLLFIGFTEKSNFDAVSEADGTVVGNSTLSIRICEKTIGTSRNISTSNGNTDHNASQSQEDILNTSGANSDILGSELDGQINDLLASIRKSEEVQTIDISKCDAPEEKKNTADGENPHDDKIDVDKDEVLETNEGQVEDNGQNDNAHEIDNTEENKDGNEKSDQLA